VAAVLLNVVTAVFMGQYVSAVKEKLKNIRKEYNMSNQADRTMIKNFF